MSEIINKANNATLSRSARIRRAISNSGFAFQQIASPSFFQLTCNLPLMYGKDFRVIEEELLKYEDGAEFISTSLPAHLEVTTLKEGSNLTVKDGATSIYIVITDTLSQGKEIQLGNVHADSKLAAGDFIQFANGTKVYQVAENTRTPVNDQMAVKIHTGVITDFPDNTGLVARNKVETFTFIPGSGVTQPGELTLTDRNGIMTTYVLAQTDITSGLITDFINNSIPHVSAEVASNVITVTYSAILGDASLALTTNTQPGQALTEPEVLTTHQDSISNTNIVIGNSVEFKFLLTQRPDSTIIPANTNTNLYQYDEFEFREVL